MAAIRTADELRRLYKQPTERSQRKLLDHLDRHCTAFVELSPMAILATTAADGRLDVAPRGGEPGFVHADGRQTLLLPDWPGNNRLDAYTGILAGNSAVGLLFLVPGVDETLRVAGTAEIRDDEELRARFATPAGASGGDSRLPTTVLAVTVGTAMLHCAKAFMRSRLWEPEARVERSTLPSLGEILLDQTTLGGGESQEAMLERYRATLY
jgi:PPOX class probable FMN-dependent enzyme